MKWTYKRELVPLAMLAIMAAIAVVSYPLLPDPMPSHFASNGRVNGWMGKDASLALMFCVLAGTYALMTFLPLIDPRLRNKESKYGLILLMRDVLLGFWVFLFFLVIRGALEGYLHLELYGVAVGLLFVVLGNYLPKMPPNWFVGIRTPWTLSSDTVWKRTHVLGGWLFVLSGAALIAATIARVPLEVSLIAVVSVLVLFSLIYSFWLFKLLQKRGEL